MRTFLKALVAIVLAAMIAGASFLAGFGVNQLINPTIVNPKAGESEYFDLFWEAWQIIEQEFFGELPDPKQLTYGAIQGALRALDDPATMLVEPAPSEDQMIDLRGAYEGIGALVAVDDEDQIVIVSPFDGSPAMQAGVRAGDVVLRVDDVAVTGMLLGEAVRLIRGPKGSTVRLTIIREEETAPLLIEVIRDEVELATVGGMVLEDDIGYVRISLFSERTSQELKETLQELMEENISGLILDLRNNPGGVFPSAAIGVASQFVDEGVIVYQQYSDGREQAHRAERGGLATDIPLVVLVNQGTASNSEVVAGAIQDHSRGVLIGEQTFGKGSVQRVHELSDGSGLHVTMALLLTPDRRPFHGEGLTPDIVAPFTEEDFLQGIDPQLERAIEYLEIGR
ncbi:MAG: S41 family peptidase [Anaerolineales bacterium]|nr:S41 family peptidase [Anaerolineales bacterium]